jgi:glycogen debranching enzyme
MLKRWLDNSLGDLTPNTRDSEVLFIITACEYLLSLSSEVRSNCRKLHASVRLAMNYIENNILSNGLIAGADWRDVREDLDDKTVLTNACFLYKAYELMTILAENTTVEERLLLKVMETRDAIQSKFWNGKYFDDYPECSKFDLLGNSLVILYGISTNEQSKSIFKHVKKSAVLHGFPTSETFLPPLNETEKNIMDRDQAVIWPFTNGFMLEAMLKSGNDKWIKYASNMYNKWSNLPGFFEWYDIVDGNGYGSPNQVWTAALYLRVGDIVNAINN